MLQDNNNGLQVPENIQNEDEEGVAVTVNNPTEDETHGFDIPDDINSDEWPTIRLTKLELVNFGKYADAVIDFKDGINPLSMACLIGPNGTGKSTILDAVVMLCSNFAGYTSQRFSEMMFHRVRNWMHIVGDDKIRNASFSVKGTFSVSYPVWKEPYKDASLKLNPPVTEDYNGPVNAEYVVEFTRHRFRSRHPEFIEQRLARYCFMARFDNELTQFQMRREKWPLFQTLFSAVTGFPIEEDVGMFHDTSDTRMRRIQDDYVLGFLVRKPKEVIRQKMCSAGEKKIAKCFSTILNATVQPSIIVVDNVLMHIEVGRHLAVMKSLSKCFPESQLIVACHSVPVSKSLPNRESIFDMRWIEVPGLVWREPWRLRLLDDIYESIERLSNIQNNSDNSELNEFMIQGALLIKQLESNLNKDEIADLSIEWLSHFPKFLKKDLFATPLPKIRWYDNRQLKG